MKDSVQTAPKRAARRSLRRTALLTSVAGLSIVSILAGPVGYNSLSFLPRSTPAAAEEMPNLPASFADIVAKVKPAVVSVSVKMEDSSNSANLQFGDNQLPVIPGSPLDKFLRQFGMQGLPNNVPQERQVIMGEGSGFFVSPSGYIVTNNHVVDHAKNVKVTTVDGAVYMAKVIGTDPKTDLALIKVSGRHDFPYVKFADHEPRVGDWVIAVGNPFGLGGTVTAGIVSAHGREIGAGPYDDYIQVDAPINKGNSGGPTFDMNGDVVGVNTAIYSPSGGSVGIGFDIPTDIAKPVVTELRDKGYVTRGWIGVQVQPVTAAIADSIGMKSASGAMVDGPQAGSPAAQVGIKPGDVITAVDGVPVKSARDLARRISLMAPGSSIQLSILRDGDQQTLTMKLGELPNERPVMASLNGHKMATNGIGHLGLALVPASNIPGNGNAGVLVRAVDPNGQAFEHGIRTGDVILDAGGKAVSNAADIRKAIGEARSQGRHDILMRIKTADATRFVALPVGHA